MADYKSGYGKKPMWFWILVYLVVGGLIYYAVYYFGYSKKGGSTNPYNQGQNQAPAY